MRPLTSRLFIPPLASHSRASSNFSFAQTGSFVQDPPHHENVFVGDAFLRRCIDRVVPSSIVKSITPDLHRFGARVSSDIWALGRRCEENPPYLRQTSAWGKRIDDIVTSEAWKEQKRVSAEEGLIAIAYEQEYEEFSRVYQMVKLSLYSPASGLYSCPLAMTDGAAKTAKSLGINYPDDAFARLTSRDPSKFWTSGQWMTEKGGGSDVAGGTETVALKEGGGYRLKGYKWFSSATDSDMTLTLARIADESGATTSGTKGLSMFYARTRNADGSLNGIQVAKLKNKLGTRQLPTAELLLDGTEATLVSDPGRGIASISAMLTITRMHNTMSSVAAMRKIVLLARDYATRRKAFGVELRSHPLHLLTLSRMETEVRGCTALMVDLAHKIGLDDCGKLGDRDSLLLRLFMPVAKMYTAKRAMSVVSEGLECFGGQGYIEDTGLPGILRDAQVLPIWEGTSNVMSLDVLRALNKSDFACLDAFRSFVKEVTERSKSASDKRVRKSAEIVGACADRLVKAVSQNKDTLHLTARDLTESLAHVYIGALLVNHCNDDKNKISDTDVRTLNQWTMERDLTPVLTNAERGAYDGQGNATLAYVFDGYDESQVMPPPYEQ